MNENKYSKAEIGYYSYLERQDEIHQIVFQDSNVTKIAATAAGYDTKVGETANGDHITGKYAI